MGTARVGTVMNLLGIEIGGTKLQLVTGTSEGKILDRQQIAVEPAAGGEGVRGQLAATFERLRPRLDWCSVGVGFGGPVDWRTGRVRCSHHLAGWDDFPLTDWLRELSGLPVAADNDTNVAAYAEATCGAGAGLSPVFYTNSGSGVGGGCISNGVIYHGAPPGEAELGLLRLDRAGTTVEERCAGWALDRLTVEAAHAQPDSLLAAETRKVPAYHAVALGQALAGGCPVAGGIVAEAGDALAFALAHVVHLFHPQAIVLGGGVALLGEPWRAAVADALTGYVAEAYRPAPEVLLTTFGELAVSRGALLLAAEACGLRQAREVRPLAAKPPSLGPASSGARVPRRTPLVRRSAK